MARRSLAGNSLKVDSAHYHLSATDHVLTVSLGAVYAQDLPNLDILRAIAVLSVVLSHILQMFWKLEPFSLVIGRTGVLIFFVHTTLVLMMSMERSGESGWALFRGFYIRRAFRIYPLSILVVLALVPTTIPDAAWKQYHWVGWTGILNDVLLISNITRTPNITAPLWSLAFEVQMYLALPLLYLAMKNRTLFDRLVVWAAAMMCTDVSLWASKGHESVLLYVPCFVAGTMAFPVHQPKIQGWLWPICVMAGILAFSLTLNGRGFQYESGGWIACLALALAIPRFQQATNRYLCAVAKLIARYSYGIYLTHMPLIWICFVRLHPIPHAGQWGLFLTLVSALPIILYHVVEAPMIQAGRRIAQSIDPTPRFAAVSQAAGM